MSKFRKHRFTNRFLPVLEACEARTVPATFTVANLFDSGLGSLRQAILDANALPGSDVIDFSTAGTLTLASGLTAITDPVNIDGTTATGYTGTPVFTIDCNDFAGLVFDIGSKASSLQSLSIINALGDGVTLRDDNNLITGNYIGMLADGATVAGNRGNGITIAFTSSGNTIGGTVAADRNVISGNVLAGVAIDGASSNTVLGNFIGTDFTGTVDVGNGGNGVLITTGATDNTIGGITPSPTQYSGLPPDGNVISGNGLNGVLITTGSSGNTLAGNFIGTDLAGKAAIGNTLDGVAIEDGSNSNALVGTIFGLQPFIYYNIMSGNGGNGLRVKDSNNTLINANFFGMGSDNDTGVPNALNGVVIEGTSAVTTFGGIIPLGNVVAANTLNGVVIQDTASGFLSFNTFAGVAAFTPNNQLGNGKSGFLITSTGGGNLIRTSVISANKGDGITIAKSATGVQIVQNIIGLNTDGKAALGNSGNGITIAGDASNITIGGPQPTFSVIPHNVISSNGGSGIAVIETAHDNVINFSRIGTDIKGSTALPNAGNGITLAAGTKNTAIGSSDPSFITVVSGNTGDGIQITGSTGNRIVGTLIGTAADGTSPLGNGGDGIQLDTSVLNTIGEVSDGRSNTIAFNTGNGVNHLSGEFNSFRANSIHSNELIGILEAPGTNGDIAMPVVSSALRFIDGLRVVGTFAGVPNSDVTIDLFADAATEGQEYLGTVFARTNGAGLASFSFQSALPTAGLDNITATATDAAGDTSEFASAQVIGAYLSLLSGASVNGGPVQIFNPVFPTDARTVVADFNGDTEPDLAAASGPGQVATVRIFDGVTGATLLDITPFGAAFTGGVFLSAGDVTGDDIADLAIAAGNTGGPRIRVLRGGTFTQLADFFAIDDVNFRGGTVPALGDLTGDDIADLTVATGAGGGPRVSIYGGASVAAGATTKLVQDFFVYDPSLRSGVFVVAGDLTGDGRDDLAFSPGRGAAPHVRIIDSSKLLGPDAKFAPNGTVSNVDVISFFAASPSSTTGTAMQFVDLDGDGNADLETRSDGIFAGYLGSTLAAGTAVPNYGLDEAFRDAAAGVFVG